MKNHKLITSFKNLMPLTTYSYSVEALNGNWPVIAVPSSGSFSTLTDTQDIETTILFCSPTGACSGITPLQFTSSSPLCISETLPFVNARISLHLPYSNIKLYGDPQQFECEECLGAAFDVANETIISDTNEHIVEIFIDNLQPYTEYTYSINNIQSNNIIGFNSLSGSFKTNESKLYRIENRLVFCDTSGYYIGYTIVGTGNSVCQNPRFVTYNVSLDSECLDNPVSSKPIRIECDDCFPERHKVNLSAISVYHEDSAVDINGAVSNLIKDHTYNYSFESIKGNWPILIYPSSGSFIANNDTYEILSQAFFCCPSGSCSGTSFPKTYEEFRYKTNYVSQDIKLNVTDTCTNDTKSSKETNIFIQFKDLIVEPSDDIYNIILDENTNGCHNLSFKVDECIKTHSYYYEYQAVGGNWPIILSSASGTFTDKTPSHTLTNQLLFCASTGLCNGRANTIFPSNLLDQSSILANTCDSNTKYIELKLMVKSNCYPAQKAFYSRPITVYCNNCTSMPSITSVIE